LFIIITNVHKQNEEENLKKTITRLDAKTARNIWHCVYLYHIREPNLTQEEIGKRLNISRIKVSRYLQQAKELGMIKIIASPPSVTRLEAELIDKFHLRDARVVMVAESHVESVKRVIGYSAAEYLEEMLTEYFENNPGKRVSIGLAGGETMYEIVQALQPGLFSGLDIYPLVAGPRPNTAITAGAIVGYMSTKYGPHAAYAYELVRFYPMSEAEKKNLLGLEQVAETLKAARNVDLAIVGIGNLAPNSTLCKTVVSLGYDIESLKQNNIIGDICSQLLYADGSVASLPIHDNIIGVTAKELRELHQKHGKRVIGVSGGVEKAAAIAAVLKGGTEGIPYIDTLVTDEVVAEHLLKNR